MRVSVYTGHDLSVCVCVCVRGVWHAVSEIRPIPTMSTISKGWFPLRKIFLRRGTDRKAFFVLKSLVPPESSQDNGNFPVRAFPEENFS